MTSHTDDDEREDVVHLCAQSIAKPGTVVTWLNHWSIQHADWAAMAHMDVIGVDGTLLQLILHRWGRHVGRTSADLVLPILLETQLAPSAPVALIGAAPGVAQVAAIRLGGRPTLAVNGFDELTALLDNPGPLHDLDPALVVVGLGAGLQERVAARLHREVPQAIVCTAGGWIDQLAHADQYFPPWIHRWRLGWAWRIAHEPRRLIGRYTVDAVSLVGKTRPLMGHLARLGGVFTPFGIDGRSLDS